jgi:hypothetical protein
VHALFTRRRPTPPTSSTHPGSALAPAPSLQRQCPTPQGSPCSRSPPGPTRLPPAVPRRPSFWTLSFGPSVLDPKGDPAQIPNYRILWDFLSLPGGSITLRAPLPPKYLSTAFYGTSYLCPGSMLRSALYPSRRSIPRLWKSALQHPEMGCAENHMKGSKMALFGPSTANYAPFPHQKRLKTPPSIGRIAKSPIGCLWIFLRPLLLRFTYSSLVPSSQATGTPCESLVVSLRY